MPHNRNTRNDIVSSARYAGGAVCRPSGRHGVSCPRASRGVNDPESPCEGWPRRGRSHHGLPMSEQRVSCAPGARLIISEESEKHEA